MRKYVRNHAFSVIEPANPRPRRTRTAALLGGSLIAIVGIAAFAQSQAKSGATGKAQVVERRGPELPIAANSGGQVVVLFPTATGTQGGQQGVQGDDVEVVLVESNVPNAQDGQPAPTAQSTGREILFSTRDANEGIVRYAFEANGGARKVMVLARVGGKYVEARQTGGGEGVTVFTVLQPQKQQEQQPQAAAAQPAADGGGQPGVQGGDGQQSNAGGGGAASGGQSGGAQGGQQGGQQAGQQPQQPATPPPPAQAAVILVYTGGTGQ